MDIVSGIVVFILLWWWVFFMTLPFGVKTPDSVEVGHATSAPEKPMLWRKAMIATIIALSCATLREADYNPYEERGLL